jgi:hypothetical protein
VPGSCDDGRWCISVGVTGRSELIEPASSRRTIQRITTKCNIEEVHNKNTSSAYLLELIVVPDDGINNAETRRTVAQEFQCFSVLKF